MIERRKRIICSYCKTPMVFVRVVYPVDGIGALVYRCPTRKGEKGCGYTKEVLVTFTEKGQELHDLF